VKTSAALGLAIKALKERIQVYAFDASMYQAGTRTPTATSAFKIVTECREALRILEDLKDKTSLKRVSKNA
jgi:hypothetical protein